MNTMAIALFMMASVAGQTEYPASLDDPRNIKTGIRIYEHGYCDQPYVVVAPDGTWVCTFTTSAGKEGSTAQYVVSCSSTDQGKTWTKPVAIEPPSDREASWAMPLITPSGRIYVFYDFNGDNVHTLPNGKKVRADMLGWYCYKYSDDKGKTWSERHRLPVRLTACDRGNDWGGEVQIMWGIGKPIVWDGVAYLAFTKLGKYMLDDGEGWFFRSDNILTEPDVSKVRWEMLPEGDHGMRTPEFESVQEEQNLVPLSNGDLYCMYRTTVGHPIESYSRDGGRTWSKPRIATYSNGRPFKHPRACPRIWRAKNGKFLFWYHNHGGTTYADRNPAWLCGGIEKDGKILWSQPEILFYGDDHSMHTGRFSYPDLIEQDGRYWITTTQKTAATVHSIDPTLLEGLWTQGEAASIAKKGLVLTQDPAKAGAVAMPALPSLRDGGFSLDMRVKFADLTAGQVVLDTRNAAGKGILVSLSPKQTIQIDLHDGARKASWDCDPECLKPGTAHDVAFIVDGGPNIITVLVDGVVCDGGTHRQYGWGRFDPAFDDVNGGAEATIGGALQSLRVYDRYLRNSEAVANARARRGN